MTKAPVADRIDHRTSYHGVTIEDPYHWLRDPAYPDVTDPRVLDYLEAENAYFDAKMGPHRDLVEALFRELKSRQPATDASVPYRRSNYWYQWRYQKEAQYRVWLRAPHVPSIPGNQGPWQVILDEPALAAEHRYFTLGGLAVSPNGRFLAWNADTSGAERFTLNILDLDSGVLLDEPIDATLGSPVWAAGSRHLLYVVVNDNWRPYQVRVHELGRPLTRDRVVYEESTEAFFVGLDKTRSEQFILINTGDHVTNEVHLLAADSVAEDPVLVSARSEGHEYHLDHHDDDFYILTNDAHSNFRLARTPWRNTAQTGWRSVIDGSDSHYLTGMACFKDYLAITERVDGLDQIRIRTYDGDEHFIRFPETAYTASFGPNAMYDTESLRVHYQSMVTPETVYDYHMGDRKLRTLKVQEVPTGYDPNEYATERLVAPARDGARIPVTVVYSKDMPRDGTAYLYLTGYGAYGHAMHPTFSASRLSLLDRGIAFATAHIRGGGDLGYQWYEDGKLDKRTNTFNDFVDCTRHLIDLGYTSAGRILISGGSAGGELMGAVVNQAPELWGAVAAHVPFVDVLNTMLDPTLPLTPIEWPEWGNPIDDAEAFALIRSYSPYDQLKPGAYPPMLVTAGLHDPRVTYWEAAKYVAKLRALKTDDNWLLLKTNMSAGHRGESGRFDTLRELAEEYAFFLVTLGIPRAIPDSDQRRGNAPASVKPD